MDKVLFVATVDSHILNFHIPYIKYFKEKGYEVHVASNGDKYIPYVDIKYNIPFKRSPYNVTNYIAYRQLKKLVDENKYKLIHCHTPMGSVLTRLATRNLRKSGTKVLYTAHGFHFYKGAPIINWLLYYPVERFLARYTDVLIAINKEDYKMAQRFKAKRIEYVPGVGIDLNKFMPQTLDKKKEFRQKLGYRNDDFIVIYVGELSYRKHQDVLIKAISLLKKDISNIKLLLVGNGNYYDRYASLIDELNAGEYIHLLGYRVDISELMTLSDIAASSSRQEGLPVNVMEAMATGLPLVVSNCRGNRDLVKNNENGFVVGIDDIEGFAESIRKLYESKELRDNFGKKSLEYIERYSIKEILKKMKNIYIE